MIRFNDETILDTPARVLDGAAGNALIGPVAPAPFAADDPKIVPIPHLIRVRARLRAGSLEQLDTLVTKVRRHLTTPPTVGTLADSNGREWKKVALIRVEPLGRVDAGRERSRLVEITFIRQTLATNTKVEP